MQLIGRLIGANLASRAILAGMILLALALSHRLQSAAAEQLPKAPPIAPQSTPQPAAKSEWPQFRGPARTDISPESSHWGSGIWGEAEIAGKPSGEGTRRKGIDWKTADWKTNVGEGASSPVISGGRLYALGWKAENDHLQCLDARTGERIWRIAYPSPRYGRHATGDEGFYSGAQGTPAIDVASGSIFTLGIDGELQRRDLREGSLKWRINLYEAYGVSRRPRVGRSGQRDYGYTSSPLVDGETVIVEVGDDEGALMAFDIATGKRLWSSENRWPAGHTAGPIPITVEGVPCVAVMTFEGLLVAVRSGKDAGKTIAEYLWKTDYANNVASPAVVGNEVVITAGYNHQKTCKLRISLRAGATKVWEAEPHSLVCTPVIHRDHIYWAWEHVYCLELATGRLAWKSPGGLGDAGSCLVTADDRLLAWTGRGTLLLAETAVRSPKAFQQLAAAELPVSGDVWPHVVLCDGRLYLRDRQGTLLCYKIGQ